MRLLKLLLVLFVCAAGPAVAGPLEDARAASNKGDYATALRLLWPLANQGNAIAQSNIGTMNGNGKGVPQDYATAMSWYRKAADQGYAPAQSNIGVMYEHGRGVLIDYAIAMSWYRKAADQGNATAQSNIGVMYEHGRGVPVDYATAMSWYRKAADQGYAAAQNNLGVLYERGLGVPVDYATAMSWYRKAANQGNAAAQTNIQNLLAKAPNTAPNAAASIAPGQPVPIADPLVVSIQTLLAALGYEVGPPDGFAGPKTAAAISAFQQSVGEKQIGRPSESLRARLQSAVAERGSAAASNTSEESREVMVPKTRPSSSGTGFFIADDIIITNNHVIEGCTEIRTRKRGAEVGNLRVVATNRADDLAALRSDKPSDHHLRLRIGNPIKSAESVLVFGYPLSSALSSSGNTTLGNVTALAGLKDDSRYFQISASVQPESSGGPALDEAGRLIGVIEGKLDAVKVAQATGDIPQNVNFAIRSSTLAHFLETNRIACMTASNSEPMPITQLAEKAEAASVQLGCRK